MYVRSEVECPRSWRGEREPSLYCFKIWIKLQVMFRSLFASHRGRELKLVSWNQRIVKSGSHPSIRGSWDPLPTGISVRRQGFHWQTFLHRRPKYCCGCCRLEKDGRLTSSVTSSWPVCHLMWGLREHGEVLMETSSWDRARITPEELASLTSWNVITCVKPVDPLYPFN